ncbi:hypothetical protein AMATHDRAFT_66172 [Amanita thiersii Skay4041]|uniref:Uncharacterized protein n=1 Tax=Amanita thiersii Skay4041 TaxID=703135 RepID=A0A2A9NIM3_9AGAR|nr:hypothetical protein AMATHDRAFT_66172 [Amanita thiersii Skay4041]
MCPHINSAKGRISRTSIYLCCLIIVLYFVHVINNDTFRQKEFPGRHSTNKNNTNTQYTSPAIPDGRRKKPRILLVSALFPLEQTKHSSAEYAVWLANLIGKVTTDVYFFAPPSLEATIRAVRAPGAYITINTTFDSVFDIPPLKNYQAAYTAMHAKDRERKIHSPDLYAVWNAKPYLTNEAIKNLYPEKQYDYVFWNDAGSFRQVHFYETWPDPGRVREVWEEGSRRSGMPEEDLLFFALASPPFSVMKNWKEQMGHIDVVDFGEGESF